MLIRCINLRDRSAWQFRNTRPDIQKVGTWEPSFQTFLGGKSRHFSSKIQRYNCQNVVKIRFWLIWILLHLCLIMHKLDFKAWSYFNRTFGSQNIFFFFFIYCGANMPHARWGLKWEPLVQYISKKQKYDRSASFGVTWPWCGSKVHEPLCWYLYISRYQFTS